MLGKKGKLLVVALFALLVYGTGQARLVLDDIVAGFRNDFREMLYLPRGMGLKILACGFDAPLADALFIKGMIYYAESFQAANAANADQVKDASRTYTYELFDVITDLSPRFTRAYQMGALFLTASASYKTNLDGVRLLQKGVDKAAGEEKEGHPIVPDGRWLFHTLMANAYEMNIQTRLRRDGDMAGAVEAKKKAGEEFRLAAASPNAPEYIRLAAAGYQSSLTGQGDAENSLAAVQAVWMYLYDQAKIRGDKDVMSDLEGRIKELGDTLSAIHNTRELEKRLSAAGRAYFARAKHEPAGAADLVKAGLISAVPNGPLGNEKEPDQWLALPDGTFKSKILAAITTQNHLDALFSASVDYRRGTGKGPQSLRELIDGKYLEAIPEPPLKALGQEYLPNPKTGVFESRMPEGPELPPDRK